MPMLQNSLFNSSFSLFLCVRVSRANFHFPLAISTREADAMENTAVAEKDSIDKADAEKVKEEEIEKNLAEEIDKKMAEDIGEPPEKPLPGDCCGSGCETCVWDIYYDQLQEYNIQKDAFLKSLTSSKP
ncbi:hypothetical protein SUGI_0056770 [Cryptomeria japonica]|nr:hypothetical protein SUGI_0056770 [Cryptomeria japonica]